MRKHDIDKIIDNYIDDMKQAVHHPLLEKNIGEVKLDRLKAFFLLLPKLNDERWTEPKHTAAIAVGAVHIAFDAHDSIDERDATSTGQQLTVLSGDYFSGIHYRLLASLPHFGFIRTLSETIGQINETKANFHKSPPIGSEQLIEAVRTIEADCITNFLHTFGFPQYAPLAAAALPLLSLDGELTTPDGRMAYGANHWSVDKPVICQVIEKFRKELHDVLDEADFLQPMLAEKIRLMTTPLLSELI